MKKVNFNIKTIEQRNYLERVKFILFFILIAAASGFAQYPEWKIYNTSNSSIGDNVIYSLMIDNNGNKWVGTSKGISKYNGSTWVKYKKINSGLPSDLVQALAQDKNGSIWVGTDKGIVNFDGATSWTVYNSSNSGIVGNNITGLAKDTSRNIVASTNLSVTKFNGSSWSSILADTGMTFHSVAVDKTNKIWVGYDDGVMCYDNIKWTKYNLGGRGNSVVIDKMNNIWVGTAVGLKKFDGVNWTTFDSGNSNIPDDYVHYVLTDYNDQVWLGTSSGLARFDGVSTWSVYKKVNSGVPDNSVISLALENCNNENVNVWVGCAGIAGGLGEFTQIYTPLCIMTVNSLGKNEIVWEKKITSAIDSFRIYRETNVAGTYALTGAVAANALSVYTDTSSLVNNNVQSYRYKIGSVTSCKQEVLSIAHRTIHLTVNAGTGTSWNLLWNSYEGISYSTINIWRGTTAGNLVQIGSVPGTNMSFTDLSPPAGLLYYQLEIVYPSGCNPTAKMAAYSSIMSNVANNGTFIGIKENGLEFIQLSPNPSIGKFILANTRNLESIDVYDVIGNIIYSERLEHSSNSTYSFDLSGNPTGIYYLKLNSNENSITKKLVLLNE